MATVRYVVYAYSPTLNQKVRRFDLANINAQLTIEQAEQDAEWFALVQNRDQYLHATDWQGLVEQEEHGIDTLPGFLYQQ